LAYTVTTQGAHGDVTFGTTGAFTYTPTAAARLAAAATLQAETDSFTVTVDDGHGGQADSLVTVTVAPAGILGQPTVSGAPNGSVVVSPDGTKAVQVTSAWPNATSERSTLITVIDTRTGLQVGNSVTVPTSQQVGSATFNADGSRVGVVSYLYNPSTNTTTSYVTIVNTATGARVGNTVEMVGSGYTGVQFSPDGGRAVVSTVTNPGTTFVAILDAATGNRVAPDMPIDGVTVTDGVTFSPNGARAYLTTNTGSQSQVVVIDTVNGVQVGDALSLSGSAAGGLQMFANGARALQTVGNGPATKVYTIDTATNTVLGTPIDLTGFSAGFPSAHAVLNANGTRAVQATNDGGPNGATRLTVIDTMAGAVIGTPTVLPGQLQFGIIQFSGDGSKVIASTMTGDFFSNNTATNIAVINAASGNQVGGTATLTGPLRRGYLINAANTRAVAILNPTGPGSGVRVAVIDLTNGAVVGSPISLAGFDSGAAISPDGTRLVDTFSDNGDGKTKIAVINLVDGTSVGVVPLGTSGGVGAPAFASDGKTVFQTLIVNDPGVQWTQVAAIDVSGAPALVGTVAIAGASTSGDVRTTLTGTRVVVTTNSGGTPIETYTTTVTVIDTAPFLVHPVMSAATVGAPDVATGVVVGAINATDPQSGPLTYTVAAQGTRGVAIVNGAGAFTYTPTEAARLAAAATLGADTDTFAVTVADGNGGRATSAVVVTVAPAGVLGQTTISGVPVGGGVTFSADGTLAVQYISDSEVVLIDTRTGRQVGNTVTLPASAPGRTAFSANGSRVAIVTSQVAAGVTTSYLTVLNTSSGGVLGNSVGVTGDSFMGAQFSPDGTRVAMATVDSQAATPMTSVTVVNAVTGALIGTTAGVDGTTAEGVKFSTDGSRAYQTATLIGPNNLQETRVFAIDTATGTLVGDPLFLSGAAAGGLQVFENHDFALQGDFAIQTVRYFDAPNNQTLTRIYAIYLPTMLVGGFTFAPGSPAGIPDGNAVLNAAGTRAVQLSSTGLTTNVFIFNPVTGQGSQSTINNGTPAASAQFSADGSKIYVLTRSTSGGGPGGSSTTSYVSVFSTETGTQIGGGLGPAAIVTGNSGEVFISPDGSRGVVIGTTSGFGGSTSNQIVVVDGIFGHPVGTPVSVSGQLKGAALTPDGSRIVVTTMSGNSTTVTVVNTADGSSAGSLSLGTGVAVGPVAIGSDGKTAFQTLMITDPVTGTQSTRVVVVGVNGVPAVIGNIALDGAYNSGGSQSTLAGARVVVTTSPGNNSTVVTVIDTDPFLVDQGM
jgi:VCBS repeat-containing protein